MSSSDGLADTCKVCGTVGIPGYDLLCTHPSDRAHGEYRHISYGMYMRDGKWVLDYYHTPRLWASVRGPNTSVVGRHKQTKTTKGI